MQKRVGVHDVLSEVDRSVKVNLWSENMNRRLPSFGQRLHTISCVRNDKTDSKTARQRVIEKTLQTLRKAVYLLDKVCSPLANECCVQKNSTWICPSPRRSHETAKTINNSVYFSPILLQYMMKSCEKPVQLYIKEQLNSDASYRLTLNVRRKSDKQHQREMVVRPTPSAGSI